MTQPRDTDALAHLQVFDPRTHGIDAADNLVTRNDRHFGVGKLTIDDMQIRSTDPAGEHLDSYLVRPRLTIGEFCPFEGRLQPFEHHRLHVNLLAVGTIRPEANRANPQPVGLRQTPKPRHHASRPRRPRQKNGPALARVIPTPFRSAHRQIEPLPRLGAHSN